MDAHGNLTSGSNAFGGTWTASVDALGQTTSRSLSLGNDLTLQSHSAYDALGRLVSQTIPGVHDITRVFDAAGNLVESSDHRGNLVSAEYDGEIA